MKNETKITYLPITIESNEDGFLAKCSAIQGAFAEGDTIKEALFNCLDVIEMIFEYRKERGETTFDTDIIEELSDRREITFTMPIEVQI